jgi:flagellar hook-associated protein 1 FlgK
MGTGLLSSAISGLQSAQIALQTAQHNISNQNTAGFNRQRIVQTSNIAMLTGAGFIGQGAHVSTVERMYDSFLGNQVNRAQTTSSELGTYYTQIAQIDNMLADPNSGLSPALQSFFTGVQQVAANPSQLPSRQAMISSAQSLVARFQGIEARLSQMYEDVNTQLSTEVATVNSYAKQIAELNQNIVIAQSSINQPANDLLDQRDQLVGELNKLIKVTTTTNSDGSFNVFFGTGQQLVVGTQVMSMTATPSAADPSKFAVGLSNAGGNQELPESLITGGSIGGLLKFRSESLDRTQNDLGRNAASLALTFNAQNALGQDLLGQSIGDANFKANFFSISQPTVLANNRNSSAAVLTAALAAPSIDGRYTLAQPAVPLDPLKPFELTRQSDGKVWNNATIAGLSADVASEGLDLTNADVSILGASTQVFSSAANGANFYTKLTNSDYRLSYDGTNHTLTRLTDGKQWATSAVVPIKSFAQLSAEVAGSEGFSFSLAGAMNASDSFVIRPVVEAARNMAVNSAVAGDTRLIAAAMPIRTELASTNSGSGKISAGETFSGFSSSSIPASGVTLAYASGTGFLTLTGVPAGENISVTVGGTTTVYPGPTIPYTSDATISFAGVRLEISGNLNDGDKFSIEDNTAGVSDGRNALALGSLQTQNTMSGKAASYQTAYAQLVSDVGNKTRQISVTGDAQQALLKQSQAAREALSGVNLDEEAANLIRYQQAYQASAKSLQIGTGLFDTLLGIMS